MIAFARPPGGGEEGTYDLAEPAESFLPTPVQGVEVCRFRGQLPSSRASDGMPGLRVKNTFIDVAEDDSEQDVEAAVKTCPVMRFRKPAEMEATDAEASAVVGSPSTRSPPQESPPLPQATAVLPPGMFYDTFDQTQVSRHELGYDDPAKQSIADVGKIFQQDATSLHDRCLPTPPHLAPQTLGSTAVLGGTLGATAPAPCADNPMYTVLCARVASTGAKPTVEPGEQSPKSRMVPVMVPVQQQVSHQPPLPIVPIALRTPSASVGAVLHGTGMCKPCAWYWKPQGCDNSQHCQHCHLCPSSELKNRKKAKVAAYRASGAAEPT
eukprot:TRINITY_DN49078_c0_g1_i1.p1 TRINITY_DN49078_c0_g1~~TRINITY_DN49078_c0_g1_i1.p1  ORF type:complete len:333 (+),score=56.09 TRINITY_DN49078_c0_g1_i1:28-999(+)